MRCVVIDDEPMALDVLKEYIEKTPFLELTGLYRNSLKALEDLQESKIDLIFLDINMPDLSGIQFLESLVKFPLVIFTTAYSKYAVESYNYQAVDYLLKPIEFDRFLKAATKALKLFKSQKELSLKNETISQNENKTSILIKSGTEYHQIKIEDIKYIEGTGNYITIVTSDKKILTLKRLKDVLKMLPGDKFIRIHKSFIVAYLHIDVIEKEQVIIKKHKIPVGEVYKKELQNFISKNV